MGSDTRPFGPSAGATVVGTVSLSGDSRLTNLDLDLRCCQQDGGGPFRDTRTTPGVVLFSRRPYVRTTQNLSE